MKASQTQVSGNHYKDYAIQPAEFIQRNGIGWCEGNAIKYVVRHRSKNGRQDIEKAIHYLNLLLEWQYPLTEADFPPLPPAEAAEIAEEVVYHSQGKAVDLCEVFCRKPEPLDFSLPSIAIECTADEAWTKYGEENLEWQTAETGSMEELIEKFDCLQALQTFREKGGDDITYIEERAYIEADLNAYATKGRDLKAARAACVLKNARRGYYAPSVNSIIIASDGRRWK